MMVQITPQDLSPPFLLTSPFPSSRSSHFGVQNSHCSWPLAQGPAAEATGTLTGPSTTFQLILVYIPLMETALKVF